MIVKNDYEITTREMVSSDVDQTLEWMKDSENATNFSKVFTREWIKEVMRNGRIFVVQAISKFGMRKTLSIGNCSIHDINSADNNATFAVLIGDKEYKGKGFGYEASKLIIDYGFDRLYLHKINSVVFPSNEVSMGLHKKLGFVEEGTQRDQILANGGVYIDLKLFGLLKSEWKSD